VELSGLAEPVRLRARVAREPDAVRAEIASGKFIVTPLWKAWGPALAARGLDRAALSGILRGYGYEVWLWAVGERTWAQSLEGLAGRVSRRVGPRAPTRATKASRVTKADRASKAGKTTKATKTARASKTPKTTKATKTARASKTPKASKSTKATKAARATRTAKAARTRRAAGPARKARRR
jgi:hypothetical protein